MFLMRSAHVAKSWGHIASKAPSIVQCFFTLTAVWIALRSLGLGRTLSFLRHRNVQPVKAGASTDLISATSHNIAVAAAYFPGRARCLEQSLGLYYHLRVRGVDAKVRIGIQPYRMSGHAWVEVDGTPVNEYGEIIRKLSVFPILLP